MITTEAIREALKTKAVPVGLEAELARALHRFRTQRETTAIAPRQREAVERTLKAVRALQVALRRADVVLPAPPVWATATWTSHLPAAWQGLVQPLDELRDRLDAWLRSRATPRRQRGAPHDGRFHLRIAVFQALQHCGVAIRVNGFQGKAARVLALVLAEADRLEGKPQRERAVFNGSQWKTWVIQHREADIILQGFEHEHGLRRQEMIRHLRVTSKPT